MVCVGLRVIVHEDHKAPIIAVNIWYHVGSKNEKPGKTGFAHLFEHLMFNGSENYNDEYFKPFKRIGATAQNGTTWLDRTNYFQNVPTTALDTALWMESDRMGHMLGAVTQERLDEQRGVVQNEKRQGDNQPYGQVYEVLQKNLFSSDHPYSWETIGSLEDLNAASLEDVQEWFKTTRSRGRHHPRAGPGKSRALLRRYPARTAGHEVRRLGAETPRRQTRFDAGPRSAGPHIHGVGRS
jgi:zinc protease